MLVIYFCRKTDIKPLNLSKSPPSRLNSRDQRLNDFTKRASSRHVQVRTPNKESGQTYKHSQYQNNDIKLIDQQPNPYLPAHNKSNVPYSYQYREHH